MIAHRPKPKQRRRDTENSTQQHHERKRSNDFTPHVRITSFFIIREFKIYDATVAKTSLKIAGSSFSIYFAIMSVCLTFES